MSFLNNLLQKAKDLVTYTAEEKAQGKKPNLLERIPMRANNSIEKVQDFFAPVPNKVRARDFVREVPEATFNVAKEIAQGTARTMDFAGRKILETAGFDQYKDIDEKEDDKITQTIFGGNKKRAGNLGEVAEVEVGLDPEKFPVIAPLVGGTLVGLDLLPGGLGKGPKASLKLFIKGMTDEIVTTLSKTTDPKIIEGIIRDTSKGIDDTTVKAMTENLAKIDSEDGIKKWIKDIENKVVKPGADTPPPGGEPLLRIAEYENTDAVRGGTWYSDQKGIAEVDTFNKSFPGKKQSFKRSEKPKKPFVVNDVDELAPGTESEEVKDALSSIASNEYFNVYDKLNDVYKNGSKEITPEVGTILKEYGISDLEIKELSKASENLDFAIGDLITSKELRKQGYDSLIINNQKGTHTFVFKPEKIDPQMIQEAYTAPNKELFEKIAKSENVDDASIKQIWEIGQEWKSDKIIKALADYKLSPTGNADETGGLLMRLRDTDTGKKIAEESKKLLNGTKKLFRYGDKEGLSWTTKPDPYFSNGRPLQEIEYTPEVAQRVLYSEGAEKSLGFREFPNTGESEVILGPITKSKEVAPSETIESVTLYRAGNLEDTTGRGLFLTPSKEYAESYIDTGLGGKTVGEYSINNLKLKEADNTTSLLNELDPNNKAKTQRIYDRYVKGGLKDGYITPEQQLDVYKEKLIKNLLKKDGFDGVKYSRGGSSNTEYQIFDVKNIKNKEPSNLTKEVAPSETIEFVTRGAKQGPTEAFGVVAGFEQDEDGNITIDPLKAGLGIVGAGLARNLNLDGVDPRKLIDRLKDIQNAKGFDEGVGNLWQTIDASEVSYAMRPLDDTGYSNAGYRFSTYPKWVPEELRSKKLMNKVLDQIQAGKQPANNASREKRLYDIFLREIETSVQSNSDEYVLNQLARDTEITPSQIDGREINDLKAYDIETADIKTQDDLFQARADLAKNKTVAGMPQEYQEPVKKAFDEVGKETAKITDRRMKDALELGIDEDVMANVLYSRAGGRLSHAEAENLSKTVRAPLQDLIDKSPQQLGLDRVKFEAYSQEITGYFQNVVKKLKAESLANPKDLTLQDAYKNASRTYLKARAGLEAGITEAGRLVEGSKMIGKNSRVPGVNSRVQQVRNNLVAYAKKNPKYENLPSDFDVALEAIDINNPTEVMKFLTKWNKTSFLRKLSEAQKAFLLSALSTHNTNALGNAIQQVMDVPVRALAGVLDGAVSKVTGRKQEVFPTEALGQIRGAFRSTPAVIENAINGLKNEHFGFELRRTEIEQGTPVPAIKGKLGEIIRLPFRLLQSADLAFRTVKQGAEGEALAIRIANKEGLTGTAYKNRVKELAEHTPADQLDLIDARTERSLMLEDLTGIMKGVEDLKNKYPAMQFVIPFYRTLVNLTREAYRMTPIRMIGQGVGKLVPESKGGRQITEMFSDQWTKNKATKMEEISRQIIGTSIITYFIMKKLSGDIDMTGPAPSNAGDREVFYGQGKLPHSIKIGDKWVEFQRVQPIGQLMQIAGSIANSIDAYKNTGQLNSQDVANESAKALGDIGSMVFTQSPFTGVSDLFDLMKGGKYNEGYAKAGNRYLGQLIGTFIPNILRRTTVAMDPIVYEKRDIRSQLQSRIPGLQKNLTPKRDLFGEIVRQGGTSAERFASPIRTSDVKANKLYEEFDTIGYTPSVPGRKVFSQELSTDAYETLQKYYGPRLRDELWKITESPGYKNLNDAQKDKILSKTSSTVLQLAREKLFPIYAQKDAQRKMWIQQGYTGKQIEDALKTKFPYTDEVLEKYAEGILAQEQENGNARFTIEELLKQ